MPEFEDFDTVYDVFEDGTAAVSRGGTTQPTEIPHYSDDVESFVCTADGELIEVAEPQQARLYAGLRALFGDIPLDVESGLVPVKVALDTNPAIAMFLYASQYPSYKEQDERTRRVARSVIAAILDVSPHTVFKYFSRMGKRCREKRVDGEFKSYILGY